jgi:hypothetical protein
MVEKPVVVVMTLPSELVEVATRAEVVMAELSEAEAEAEAEAAGAPARAEVRMGRAGAEMEEARSWQRPAA